MSTNITIGDCTVHQDEHGRFSLNDLHRASGGEARHRPAEFLRRQDTVDLLTALESEEKYGPAHTFRPVETIMGRNGGTFVVRELVYAYAMWVSAAFHLKVIRAFDALATGHLLAPALPQLPTTYLSALKALVASEEEKERLLAESTRQAELLAAQAPKVDAFHRLQDAQGTFCLRDAAKVLGMGQQAFIARLLKEDFLYRTPGGELRAHAEGEKRGRFTHKAGVGHNSGHAYTQPRLTASGLTWLATRWKLTEQPLLPLGESAPAATPSP